MREERQRARDEVMARGAQAAEERTSRHLRICQLAAAKGYKVEEEMRTTTVARLRERWRWRTEPVGGAGERLVMFEHAGTNQEGREDERVRDAKETELRAAILRTSFGWGLFAAGYVKHGQYIGWYAGDTISEQQYNVLTEATGLWHTLAAPHRRYLNGIHSNTGMKYANSGRSSRPNNAGYHAQTAILQAKAAIMPGQEVLLAYGWRPAAWAEIDSKVVGICAWEERGPDSGLGTAGGQYIEEIITARPGEGIGASMLREIRRDWQSRRGGITGDIVELAVHTGNSAKNWYRRLGMEECRRWERVQGRWELQGDGLYIPEGPPTAGGNRGGAIMRTSGKGLEGALRCRREGRGGEVKGTHHHLITGGIDELKEKGLLAGVRAMANRVYAGQSWWLEGDRSRIECLYRKQARACPTRFIIVTAEDEEEGNKMPRTGDG